MTRSLTSNLLCEQSASYLQSQISFHQLSLVLASYLQSQISPHSPQLGLFLAEVRCEVRGHGAQRQVPRLGELLQARDLQTLLRTVDGSLLEKLDLNRGREIERWF